MFWTLDGPCALVASTTATIPMLGWVTPFVLILLAIALLPLLPHLSHWWEHNRNKLIVALVLGVATLLHYQTRGFGTAIHNDTLARVMSAWSLPTTAHDGHTLSGAGSAAAVGALGNALFDYIPFITLLFTLYCVAGGIAVKGDIPAHPSTNTLVLGLGGLIASVIGTTGASMLLIRPLLQINSERKRITHTVIFFIFIVSNVGGCLLPTGDPPLFIGYLRGVPFLWTLGLWQPWLFMTVCLLAIYYVCDRIAWRREAPQDIFADEHITPGIQVLGRVNFFWLALAVFSVATLDPGKPFLGSGWTPPPFLREGVQLMIVAMSFLTTPGGVRQSNGFNFTAIGEVACLFIGIFITMQVPLEILAARGPDLHLEHPWQFFWASGVLSSFLDNAPTYAVFFQTAGTLTHGAGPGVLSMAGDVHIQQSLLTAVSLGSVFMGANTYIGNGPNFMVKSIAESQGVKMPSFFGYMLYSGAILVPLFVAVTFIFLVGG